MQEQHPIHHSPSRIICYGLNDLTSELKNHN